MSFSRPSIGSSRSAVKALLTARWARRTSMTVILPRPHSRHAGSHSIARNQAQLAEHAADQHGRNSRHPQHPLHPLHRDDGERVVAAGARRTPATARRCARALRRGRSPATCSVLHAPFVQREQAAHRGLAQHGQLRGRRRRMVFADLVRCRQRGSSSRIRRGASIRGRILWMLHPRPVHA